MIWRQTTNCSWIFKRILKCRESVEETDHWGEQFKMKNYKTYSMYKALQGEKDIVGWRKMLLNN